MLLSSVVRLTGEKGGLDPNITRRQRIRPERRHRLGLFQPVGRASVASLAAVNPEKRSMVGRWFGRAL